MLATAERAPIGVDLRAAQELLDGLAGELGVRVDVFRACRPGRPAGDHRERNLLSLRLRAFARLREHGATNETIASALGCSVRSVNRLAGRAGK